MIRSLLFVLVFPWVLGSCTSERSSPEVVYRSYHQKMARHARAPHAGYQTQAYGLLAKESQRWFEERAEAINAQLPEGVQEVQASSLLRIRALRFDDDEFTIEKDASYTPDDEEVLLHATWSHTARKVHMVREPDGWKVALTRSEAR